MTDTDTRRIITRRITPAARQRAERYAEIARSYHLDVKVGENALGQVQVIARRTGQIDRFLQILVTASRGDRTCVYAIEHTVHYRNGMRRVSVNKIGSLIQAMGH